MRCTLFGGIGLALSVFANSAAAQDGRDGRAARTVERVAKLGAPSALPDAEPVTRAASPDEDVTPAGLRSRVFGRPVAAGPIQVRR